MAKFWDFVILSLPVNPIFYHLNHTRHLKSTSEHFLGNHFALFPLRIPYLLCCNHARFKKCLIEHFLDKIHFVVVFMLDKKYFVPRVFSITKLFKLGRNCPLCCVVPGSWSFILVWRQNYFVGGCWSEPFQLVACLGGDTMPGQWLLQVPLCRRKPEGIFLFTKILLLVSVQCAVPSWLGRLLGGLFPIGEFICHLK